MYQTFSCNDMISRNTCFQLKEFQNDRMDVVGYLSANWTSSGVLTFGGKILHRGCHQSVGSKEMPFQSLKGKRW